MILLSARNDNVSLVVNFKCNETAVKNCNCHWTLLSCVVRRLFLMKWLLINQQVFEQWIPNIHSFPCMSSFTNCGNLVLCLQFFIWVYVEGVGGFSYNRSAFA